MQHEGAATTATIAAYNFVCAQTKAETTRLNAAQTRVESRRVASSGSNNLPYHVQIKNVKCASIWCKHRNVQCAITTQDKKTRTNEKKK